MTPVNPVGDGTYWTMAAKTDAQWVPVAVSADILAGTVVPARLPTGPIAVWRSATGNLYANGDRCPHRGMRLSHGFVRGETLSCIYHGWRFGTDGACQKIPAHPSVTPPKTINCGPLHVAETNGVVWAAAKEPAEPPQFYPGYEALRSLVIVSTPAAIAAATNATIIDGAIQTTLGGQDAVLLMSPQGPQEVFILVLARPNLNLADRLAVSSALEALRRSAEAVEGAA